MDWTTASHKAHTLTAPIILRFTERSHAPQNSKCTSPVHPLTSNFRCTSTFTPTYLTRGALSGKSLGATRLLASPLQVSSHNRNRPHCSVDARSTSNFQLPDKSISTNFRPTNLLWKWTSTALNRPGFMSHERDKTNSDIVSQGLGESNIQALLRRGAKTACNQRPM